MRMIFVLVVLPTFVFVELLLGLLTESLQSLWARFVDRFFCPNWTPVVGDDQNVDGPLKVETSLDGFLIPYVLTVVLIQLMCLTLFAMIPFLEILIRDKVFGEEDVSILCLLILWLVFLPVYLSMFKIAGISVLPLLLRRNPLSWPAALVVFYLAFFSVALWFRGAFFSLWIVVPHVGFHLLGWYGCVKAILSGIRSVESSGLKLETRSKFVTIPVSVFWTYVPQGMLMRILEYEDTRTTTTYEWRIKP